MDEETAEEEDRSKAAHYDRLAYATIRDLLDREHPA